jgi:hypothetical protein
VLNAPGLAPELFLILADALARHIKPELAPFVQQVFSLHDTQQLQSSMARAGFTQVSALPDIKTLALPPAAAFLWQYLASTPLAAAAAEAGEAARANLKRDIAARWERYAQEDGLTLELRVVTASARKT